MTHTDRVVEVEVAGSLMRLRVEVDGTVHSLDSESWARVAPESSLWNVKGATSNGKNRTLTVQPGEDEHEYLVYLNGEVLTVRIETEHDRQIERLQQETATSVTAMLMVKAPMPGLIKEILVTPGDQVRKGSPLCILEAMKMENELKSPGEYQVSRVVAEQGGAVEKNAPLMELQPVG